MSWWAWHYHVCGREPVARGDPDTGMPPDASGLPLGRRRTIGVEREAGWPWCEPVVQWWWGHPFTEGEEAGWWIVPEDTLMATPIVFCPFCGERLPDMLPMYGDVQYIVPITSAEVG